MHEPGEHTPGGGASPRRLTDRQKWAFAWMKPSGVVIDVGSSDTPLLGRLHEKARRVIAVDIDRAALDNASHRVSGAQFVVASASAVPLADGIADTVLLLDVLEHVPDAEGAIAEIHRLLRPGGTLLLSVPHAGLFAWLDPQNMSARLKGRLTSGSRHRHYSAGELCRLLGPRFRVCRVRRSALFLYPITFGAENFLRKRLGIRAGAFLRRVGDLDNDVAWGRLGYNLMLEAEKTNL